MGFQKFRCILFCLLLPIQGVIAQSEDKYQRRFEKRFEKYHARLVKDSGKLLKENKERKINRFFEKKLPWHKAFWRIPLSEFNLPEDKIEALKQLNSTEFKVLLKTKVEEKIVGVGSYKKFLKMNRLTLRQFGCYLKKGSLSLLAGGLVVGGLVSGVHFFTAYGLGYIFSPYSLYLLGLFAGPNWGALLGFEIPKLNCRIP